MIDDGRAAKWTKEATAALVRNLDKNEENARQATIILALLADRKDRERLILEQQ